MKLAPDHLEDLLKSGLTNEMIEAAGIFSVPPADINKIFGWKIPIKSLLAFPYPGCDGFIRYKLFPPYKQKKDEHTMRYYQKKDSGIHLYIPPTFNPKMSMIVITEGEKKALKATQEGLNCLGLGGIWNFSVKGNHKNPSLVEDFNLIEWSVKKVEIVPDSDFLTKEGVKHAVYRLGSMLERLGAEVYVVCLPTEEDKGKLDDYLCKHNNKDYLKLRRITLDHNTFKNVQVKEKKEHKITVADTLIALAKENCKIWFLDQYETTHARFPVQGHMEHYPVKSRSFKNWLRGLYYNIHNKGVTGDALHTALNTLEAIARYEGQGKITLYTRVADCDGDFWYDLSNDKWQAIKIEENNWKVVNNPPILFRRLAHQAAQYLPDQNGNLDKLYPFLKAMKDESHKLLSLVWIVSCFIPEISHPILIPYGSQGSGKTTLTKYLKRIIDPSLVDIMGMLKDYSDLIQSLNHHWLIAFDNLSVLSRETQDTLSRAVTGASHTKRKLYTDEEDIILNFKRCLIINGINIPATRPDILDRCLLIKMTRMSQTIENKKDEILNKEFNEALPSIVGGILTTISKAKAVKKEINLHQLPRMADFTEWGYAIAQVIGGRGQNFLDAYYDNIRFQNTEVLISNPFATVLMNFMEDQNDWKGTPSALLTELEGRADEREKKLKSWPKAPNTLTRRLNELETNLEEAGIYFEIGHSGTRSIRLWKSFLKDRENTVQTVQDVHALKKQDVTYGRFMDSSKESLKELSRSNSPEHNEFGDTDSLDSPQPILFEKNRD